MLLLRLLFALAALLVAGCVGAYFLTGRREYLQFSWRVFRYTIFVAFLFFGLLILERLGLAVILL